MLSITNINNYNVNFTSGLSQKTLARGLILNTENLEKTTLRQRNIDAKFDNNKPLALCFENVLKIFDLLREKTKSGIFLLKFPKYRVYDPKDLIFETDIEDFCLPETQLILKNEPPFETASIFQKKVKSLNALDEVIESDFKQNKRSSGHFLAEIIHEIMHTVYINHIYKKYGYSGDCSYTKKLYPPQDIGKDGFEVMEELEYKTFSRQENEVLESILGTYSTLPFNQYHEVFAETFTQLICNTLSKDNALPVANPLENLKKYPKEFLKILFKVLQV